jgi:hypothetical protein
MQSNMTSDATENQVVLNNAAPEMGTDKGVDKAPKDMNKGVDKGADIPSQGTRPGSTENSTGGNGHGRDNGAAKSDEVSASSDKGAAKSDEASAGSDKSAECQGATGGNREQLRRRVEARVGELEAECAKLCEGTNSERAQALSTALQIARDVCGTGWEHVGELEAVRLSQWLDTTEPLVATGKTDETGVMMGGAKPHAAAVNQATAPLNATTTPDTDSLPTARPVTADYPRS